MKKILLIAALTAGLLVQPTQCFNFNWKKWGTMGAVFTSVCIGLYGYYKGWFADNIKKQTNNNNNKNKKWNNEKFDDVIIFTKSNENDDNSFTFLLNTKSNENRFAKKSDFTQILSQVNSNKTDIKTICFPPNSNDPNNTRTVKIMYVQLKETEKIKTNEKLKWTLFNNISSDDMLIYQFINQSVGPAGLNNLIKTGKIDQQQKLDKLNI